MKKIRALGALGAVAGGVVLTAGPALAHIEPEEEEVPAGAFASVTLTVPHGCEDSPTRQLTIQVPEQLNEVSPQVHPGWGIEVINEDLPEPVDDGEGGEITERTKEVVFTAERGNELPPHFRDQFTLGYQAPDAEGETLYFKVIQTCVEGETPWIEEWDGEDEEPEHPAPAVKVTAATGDEHGGGEEADEAAAEAEEASADNASATSDSSDSSDDSDSSTGIAVAGLVAGLAGLAAGGFALVRSRKPTSTSSS